MKKAVEVLLSGGVIAFKTDTVMGLGANGFDKFAVKKLFKLKNRDYKKPVSVLLPTVNKIFDYAVVSEFAFEVIKKHFPGAITCILKAKKCIYTTPLTCGETTGIRVPKLPELQVFLAELNFPLVATSANISGKPPLSEKNDVLETFGNTVYYLDFGYNIKMSGIASTVVDCSGDKVLVLRKGSIEI